MSPPSPHCSTPRILFCVLAGLLGAMRLAAEIEPVGPVIELPTFTVTETRDLPPPESWRYAEIPGFEILTNASDRATQHLLRDFQLFQIAASIVWPAMQYNPPVPAALVLCGKGGKFDAFIPKGGRHADRSAASLTLRNREHAAIVLDLGSPVIQLATPESTASAAAATDGSSTVIDGFEVDYFKQLRREYIYFILGRFEPRSPAWLEEGLAQLFMAMDYSRKYITFAKVEDPNLVSPEQAMAAANAAAAAEAGDTPALPASAPQQDRDFNAALARRALLPMELMFSVESNSDEARNSLGSTWAKQAYAFVHYCLYGDNGRHQKAFLAFISRLGRGEPASEALFKECFGMSYKDMLLQLRGYILFTAHKAFEFQAKKGRELPEPPPLQLREATQAEVGRIKGQTLLLAGQPDASRLALIAPYIRGERDPQLLAALGLHERASGRDDRARKFLEAAVAAKTKNTRAHLELARLRLAEARAAARSGKLNSAQMAAVLDPLFTARTLPPPLPEVYETIADVWALSPVKPSRENLAVLSEGVQRFPRRIELVYQTAQLQAQNGFPADADALIQLGLRVAPDAATKERFEQLKATRPAVPRSESPPPPVSPPPAE